MPCLFIQSRPSSLGLRTEPRGAARTHGEGVGWGAQVASGASTAGAGEGLQENSAEVALEW